MGTRLHVGALALLLTACGSAPAGSTAAPTAPPESRAAPSPSIAASPSGAAAERLYPYLLGWPDTTNAWRFATAVWDGEARVDSGDQYTDFLQTTDGRLFAFGLFTDDGAEALRDLVAEKAEEWHACDREPTVEEPLAGGGTDGIYGEYTCAGGTVLRWFGANDGFSLFVALIVGSGVDPDEASARFKEQIADLEWTS